MFEKCKILQRSNVTCCKNITDVIHNAIWLGRSQSLQKPFSSASSQPFSFLYFNVIIQSTITPNSILLYKMQYKRDENRGARVLKCIMQILKFLYLLIKWGPRTVKFFIKSLFVFEIPLNF